MNFHLPKTLKDMSRRYTHNFNVLQIIKDNGICKKSKVLSPEWGQGAYQSPSRHLDGGRRQLCQ